MSESSYKSLEEGRSHRRLYDKIFRNTKVDRYLDIFIEIIFSVFAFGTVIYIIVEASSKRTIYFFFDASILISLIFEIKFVKYYRKGKLEPKFKKLILGFGISILLQCNIALFIVIFNHYK
ncbi:hypothetical protein H8356DRAFT_573750 [Neocallimastix lanati (nom. inval.)]|uniref:Ion transport domain-containing protein n=1 Tax=Neocallimastix californiae TaxID=1754190 RepID=A0A1Y2CH86_9FUNG|nr:hypothetical protein H8356DRAFT_573750 [Neocallimastix sp. JGI-2020a]ORY46184.1 hypothetical protein LY90DRAFT_14721 [Neocallimastix californiae]|eukprot:ORY46184.1 hypothetical protein LY90DRAFT_14721 [Neocallimastix californiae]